MLKRVISGTVITAVAVIVLFVGDWLLGLTLLVLSLIAFHELNRAMDKAEELKTNPLEFIGMIAIILYYCLLFIGDHFSFSYAALLFPLFALVLMVFLAVYVLTYPRFNSNQVMSTFFDFIYGPIMLSFVYLTRNLEHGLYFVWLIFIGSWICDTCAYAVGSSIGKHKLAPVLSPKKSIEGSIGGILGSMVVGFLYGHFLIQQLIDIPYTGVLFAIISGVAAIISQIGDLAASGIKRNQNIKDYGKLIPGHGGVMDRFDSVIFTAPLVYSLLLVWMLF